MSRLTDELPINRQLFSRAQPPEHTDEVVAALAGDAHVIQKSGKAPRVAELRREYGLA